jgi:hypothetical protein
MRIPKVGEIWIDNTWPLRDPNRKCKILRVQHNHVAFVLLGSGAHVEWLIDDFIADARLDESENVKQILKNYEEN